MMTMRQDIVAVMRTVPEAVEFCFVQQGEGKHS